ncbi:MAG: CoA-binding protein [Cyclobacteriaceae bacterium]|nr:MAG: CoA-binding protein [Cyclobacteriaceae bacterium]
MKKTVILGASANPARYAYMAAEMLTRYGHEIAPIGIKKGVVCGVPILPLEQKPYPDKVHTITLYISQVNQQPWLDYIIALKPVRIIFNPGTENPELEHRARMAGIEIVHGCTLVMLRTGQY